MGLNKQKGNMYGFVTHTWNPLAGECPHKCSYCSTNKLKRYPSTKKKYSGTPRIDESQLKTNLGKGNFIFVCAQNDLFAGKIKYEEVCKILDHCKAFDNKYLFQTKNPYGFHCFDMPEKSIFCTTIETNREYEQMGNTLAPRERAYYLPPNNYITIEPIMDFDLTDFLSILRLSNPKQINIGSNTLSKIKLPEPPPEKIRGLIEELEKFTKVVQKENLKRLLK